MTVDSAVMISRATLALALALALLAAPLAAEAQSARKVPRIAFLTTTSPGDSPSADAFRQGLRDLGYVESQNVVVEWRWGRGSTERFPEFAAEVVRLKVDAIVAANDPAGHATQKATKKTIPIVDASPPRCIPRSWGLTAARISGPQCSISPIASLSDRMLRVGLRFASWLTGQ